jgi:argininosuccinate lyase
VGEANAVAITVHNTPFGDIVDTEDDLQPLVYEMFRDATRAVTLVASAMASAEFDAARLAEVARLGWITGTELADTLTRDHGLPFRTSHTITGRFVGLLRGEPSLRRADALDRAAREVLGRPLPYDDSALDRILSPGYFVSVRKTLGGPAPEVTAAALVDSRATLARDDAWLSGRIGRLRAAETGLREAARAL